MLAVAALTHQKVGYLYKQVEVTDGPHFIEGDNGIAFRYDRIIQAMKTGEFFFFFICISGQFDRLLLRRNHGGAHSVPLPLQ